ncbi:MAG TPA: AI-2E family transporter [Clostridia bacterium]|nr:AI-2E family transporter [Clostridia bacterium]
MTLNKKQILTLVLIIGGVMSLVLLFYYVYFAIRSYVFPILTPFIFAIGIAYLVNPLVNLLIKKGMHRIVAIIIIYVSILAVLAFFIIWLIPRLISELNKLTILFPRYVAQIHDFYLNAEQNINNMSLPEGASEIIQNAFKQLNILPQLVEKFQTMLQNLIGGISNFVITFIKGIFNFVMALILSFYFLKDVEKFKAKLVQIVPPKYTKQIFHLFRDINDVLAAFIRGRLTVCLIIGLITFLGLTILGVDFALLFGVIAAVTELIPYFGPIIGSIPPIIVAALQSPWLALKTLVLFVVIQQAEGNIITPKIVGTNVGFHPALVIFVLLVGGQWKGVIGMLLAIPIAAIIKVVLKHIALLMTDRRQEER